MGEEKTEERGVGDLEGVKQRDRRTTWVKEKLGGKKRRNCKRTVEVI